MKLKEALAVLAYAPFVFDAKYNTLYEPHGVYTQSSLEYDAMVDKYGEQEIDEISAGQDYALIVRLKEVIDESQKAISKD